MNRIPTQSDLQDLQLRGGDYLEQPAVPRNAITFALQFLAPNQVEPRMLAGLRRPHNPFIGLKDTPPGGPVSNFGGGFTNSDMAALALHDVMAGSQ